VRCGEKTHAYITNDGFYSFSLHIKRERERKKEKEKNRTSIHKIGTGKR